MTEQKPALFFKHLKTVTKQIEKTPELLSDKLWRVQNLYPIQDKSGRLVPLKLNKHQLKLIPLIKKNWSKTPPDPIVILKSRQVGITTFFCIWFLDNVLAYSGISAAIQAHQHESMNDIFKIVRMAYDNMHPVFKSKETDKFSSFTKTEVAIGENNSTIEVKLSIRGKSINNMLFSEKAFIKDDRDTATQGSLAPNCLVVNESSPFGLNKFHKLYRTEKPKGNSFFIPWWEHDEYEIPCPKPLEDKTNEELDIQKNYPLITDSKLLFRRNKIDQMQLLPFEQEYPLNDIECFLLSGESLLDRRLLADLEKQAENKEKQKVLKLPNFQVDFYEIPTMEDLKKEPKAFFVGVDTAEGVGKDFSTTVVLSCSVNNNYQVNQSMIAQGYLPPDDHAMETYRLVKEHYVFDNIWPFLVCERNNTGHAFLSTLRHTEGFFYPNLYYYKDSRIGFPTTHVSRKIILHDIFNAIRGRSLDLNCLKTIGELLTLTKTEAGKIQADEGEHDDLVFANAFAYHGFFSTLGQGRFFNIEDQVTDTDAFS